MKRVIFALIAALLAVSQGSIPALANPAQQVSPCPELYTVQNGDYLGKISVRCNISIYDLLSTNPEMTRQSKLSVGETIYIPAPRNYQGMGATDINYSLVPYTKGRYTVRNGETLGQIAETFDTTVNELMNLNPEIVDPRIIFAGQVLRLPEDSSSPFMLLSSRAVKPNYAVGVTVYNFPANADIDFYLINVDTGVEKPVQDGKTDATGMVSTYIALPSTAPVGSHWRIRVTTTYLPEVVSKTSLDIVIVASS